MTDSEKSLTNLLHKIAKEQDFCDYKLNVKEISSGGANYTSKLYIATISDGHNELDMFAKVAAIGEKFRSQAPQVYECERFVYTKLVKVYEDLQNKYNVPEAHRLNVPKFYGCDPAIFQETIVLENLVTAGYNEYDRFQSINWPYASSAMDELSKMHALSIAYAKYQQEEFEEVVRKLRFDWKIDDPNMKSYMDMMFGKAMPLIVDENREKVERFYKDHDTNDMMQLYQAHKQPVLGHGDYRPSNLMHKNNEDGTVDIKIVDLQTMQGSSPVVDLLYFIFTGSDEAFRAQYYDKLIEYYYEQLSAAMRRLSLDPDEVYSRADFDHELNEKLPFGLTIAIFALPIVTVSAENAPKVDENMDLTSFSVQNTSDLYAERLNGVVNDYIKWGILK